jgi:hypothetical protein
LNTEDKMRLTTKQTEKKENAQDKKWVTSKLAIAKKRN